LEARGADFAHRFDAQDFLTLSESIDVHDVNPADVVGPTTLVSFDTDTLVPPWLVDELARSAPGVTHHVELRSPFGHDAFLKEVGLVSDVIRAALDDVEVAR
jgi:homoserine O-acetyltransferase